MTMHDVVVVGAGVAGLVAATRLERSGRSVAVLEARSRVGGRTWSPELAEEARDLGATWVWGSEPHVLELIAALGLKTFPSWDEGDALYEVPGGVQRVQRPRSVVPAKRLVGGTGAIAAALQPHVSDLRLGCAVRALEPIDGGVRVVCDVGDERARHVVVALPPALVGSTIQLAGADAEARARLAQTPTWMADIAKVVAVYERPFWRDAGLSCVISRTGPMIEIHDMSGPDPEAHGALFGFVPQPLANEGWEDQAREQLVRLFGDDARDPIAWRAHAWWADAATARRPLDPRRDGLFGHPWLRQPLLDGRVHLASTETSAVSTGHIEGAVRRGLDVAQALTTALS